MSSILTDDHVDRELTHDAVLNQKDEYTDFCMKDHKITQIQYTVIGTKDLYVIHWSYWGLKR